MSELEIVEEFKQALFDKGRSEKTIVSYVGDIKGFLEWLKSKNVEFKGYMNRFHINSYKVYMLEFGYKVNTYNKKINSLIAFNEFLIDKNYIRDVVCEPKDKLKIASGSEKEVEVFSDEEIERILFHIQDKKKTCDRDRAVILILLYVGLRVSELVSIKIKHIDFLTQQLLVYGKGGKTREVPLKQEVLEGVKSYIESERAVSKYYDSEYLFVTQRAVKPDKDTINKILNRIGEALKVDMYPHKFRHTFCTMLLKKNVSISTVSKLAGHASIETTSKFYINTSRQDKLEAVNLL